MYVVHVVQSGAGLGAVCQKARTGSTHRAVCADASNASVIPLHEAPAAAPDALTCQPTRRTTVPLLRQIAVLMRTPEHQQRLPAVATARCSAQDSCSVLTATTTTTTSTTTNTAWGEGPDPLVIHLPGADGTSESSPADPASCGLPSTPTVVSNSHSLALRDPSAVQRRQPPAGELRFIRPGSNGSRTLPTMMQQRGPNTLQSRAAAAAPAPRTEGSLQPKAPNPLGFLPALQWGSNSTYWGSPIGGTLFVNPQLEQVDGQQAGANAAGMSPAAAAAAAQRSGQHQRMHWGSPIGGTLFINPSVDEVLDAAALDAPAAHVGADAAAGRATVAAAATSASSSYSTLPGMSKKTSKSSRLPFLPPFQWGSPSSMQWGSPIGGTLYINPQAPAADWHDGPWGHGGSGFGSSSSGGGSSPGSGSSSSSSKGGGASHSSIGGVASKQPSGVYVNARAAQASWGGVPPGLGLVKLGVGLMAAMAAAMLAVYLKSTPTAGSNSSTSSASVQVRTAAPAAGGAAGAASTTPGAVAAPAESGAEGVGFHQWMVQRLQSTLDSFEAEQALLKTELSVLNSMPAAGGASRLGVLGGLNRWLGGSTTGGSSKELSEAAAAAAAVSGGATARVVASGGRLSPADVAARAAEIQEQLDSLDVLKSALGVELSEQQEQLRKAQSEVQASQDQLAALTRR